MDDHKATLIEPIMPKPRLIIFGGHISKPLSEFTSRTGFSVTVIDDRPSSANSTHFPEANRVICEDFERSFDFVVVITRGQGNYP